MPGVAFRSDDIPDLSGQIIIVTGGNAGLGLETIRQLSKHNPARIYLAARSQEKAEAAINELKGSDPQCCPISFLHIDLSSLASVKNAANHFLELESRLDILVNNAGIMMTPEGLTEDGYEIQFGTNVIGPALLSQLLLPMLQKTSSLNPEVRVVVVASASEAAAPSDAYKFEELKTKISNRHTTVRYGQSKLANVHFCRAMAERHSDVKFICVHPGMVATNLHHNSKGIFLRPFLYTAILFATPVSQGALSQIWASVSPDAEPGKFYGPIGKVEIGSKASRSRDLQEKLFEWIQKELEGHLSLS